MDNSDGRAWIRHGSIDGFDGGSSVATGRSSHVLLQWASWLVHFTLLMRVQLIVIRVRCGGTVTSVTGYIRKYSDGGLMPVAGKETAASNTSRCTLGPPSCFTVAECEWCRTLTPVLILRKHGSIPPLHSDSSGFL